MSMGVMGININVTQTLNGVANYISNLKGICSYMDFWLSLIYTWMALLRWSSMHQNVVTKSANA